MPSTDPTMDVPQANLRVPNRIPSFLFNSSLRLICLRSIVVAGMISIAFEIYWGAVAEVAAVPLAVTFGVIVFHHLLTALGPRFVPLFIWLDLLLMLAELAFGIYAVALILPHMNQFRWFSQPAIGGTFILWVFTVMVASLLLIKAIQLIEARGCSFSERVDILKDRLDDGARAHRLRGFSDESSNPWWRYPVHVLLGRKIWERKLPGEAVWISFLRGLLALVVIVCLAMFALFQVVVQPVSEMGLTPNREFRSEYLSETFTSTTPVVWNIIVIHLKRKDAPKKLRESVAVQPLWGMPPGTKPSEVPFSPPCEVFEPTRQMVPRQLNLSFYEVVVFHCPPRVTIPPEEVYYFNPSSVRREDMRPNLLLRANFAKLVGASDTPNDRADMNSDSLKVYLALITNIENVLLTTRPIILLPGMNLVGVADFMVRQRLKARELSTFGLLGRYDTFLMADIPYTAPDPKINHPTLNDTRFPPGVNFSTLRIARPIDAREWTVIQDYRNKSILGGLAAIGGLGSTLSLLFIVLFGNSLLGIVYRTKPLSPFGILHLFENQRTQLVISTNDKYTALRSDLAALKDNPGLLALILDTLIDLDVITEEHLHKVNVERKWKALLRDVEKDQEVQLLGSDLNEESEPMIQETELPLSSHSEVRRASTR